MNEIKSLWDDWNNQCYYLLRIGRGFGEEHCAIGWLDRHRQCDRVGGTVSRVAGYIRQHYDVPEIYVQIGDAVTREATRGRTITIFGDAGVIVWANNELRLTPEQFREIDRASQVEEAARMLVESADVPVAVIA